MALCSESLQMLIRQWKLVAEIKVAGGRSSRVRAPSKIVQRHMPVGPSINTTIAIFLLFGLDELSLTEFYFVTVKWLNVVGAM